MRAEVRSAISQLLGISEELVDLLSVWEVVRMTACGLSIPTIAEKLSITEEDVKQDLGFFTDNSFLGFQSDLDYNVEEWYNTLGELDVLEIDNTPLKSFLDKYNQVKGEIDKVYGC